MNRSFTNGFLIGMVIFLMANLMAAEILSDCGLLSLFGLDSCADDIARAGFPLVFFEQGGIVPRDIFNLPYLLLDIFLGLDFGTVCGFIGRYIAAKNMVVE